MIWVFGLQEMTEKNIRIESFRNFQSINIAKNIILINWLLDAKI